MGLHRAGFEVVGFDIEPQKNYPFEFHQQDALTVDLHGFDAVWASPPCQAYSIMRNLLWLRDKEYPALIDPIREVMEAAGIPWIIENVMGAHLPAGWLCGTMFGLRFYRHRVFETNWFWMQPGHPRHQFTVRNGRMMGARARDVVFGNDGHGSKGVAAVREAMQIDWMTQSELSQAIPPAYSEFLGKRLIRELSR